MTPVQLRVLRLLSNAPTPLWPLHIAHTMRVPYGTVYQAFRHLYGRAWAVGVTERPATPTGRPARVLYRLTAEGRKQAALLLDAPEERSTTP